MIVRIQSDPDKIIPHHFDACCALFGCQERMYKWKYVTYEEVQGGDHDLTIPNNLYVGSVEFMTEVFNRVGIELDDIRLPKNSNRDSEISTMGDVRARVKGGAPLFVKPIQTKLFTGFVMDDLSIRSVSFVDDSTPVRVYEPFKCAIASEWRVYIDTTIYTGSSIHVAIKGIKNYSGNEFIIPSKDWLANIIEENIYEYSFPEQYVIDVGVLDNGEHVVIEYNDMWAIGNYGLENDRYFDMLKDRYFNIMRKI